MSNLPTVEELEQMKSEDLKAFGGGAIMSGVLCSLIFFSFIVLLVVSVNAIFSSTLALAVSVVSTYLVLSSYSKIMYRSIKIYSMVMSILEKRGIY